MDQYGLFIDGEWREPSSKSYFKTLNPATEEPIAEVANGNRDDAKAAILAARKAFDTGPWPRMSPQERCDAMMDLSAKIMDASDELAQIEAQDSGAVLRRTQMMDVNAAAMQIQYFAQTAAGISLREELPENLTTGPSDNFVLREPIGVCAGIIPWNFPLLMAIWKIGPAIAMGNTVVLKPASYTPLSARRLMQCIEESAIPDGVVNFVTGGGSTVGEELASSPLVDKIAFTGSTEVGRRIMQLASTNIKKVTLELGGKSANIVLDDADIDCAVDGALYATFFHQGQVCESGTRLFLSEKVHDDFVGKMVERSKAINMGDPLNMMSTMGPLVSDAQRQTVENYVNIGIDEGAKIACGGNRPEGDGFEKGYWFEPTIFVDVDNKSRLAQEEIFGPVLSVIKYSDVDDAIAMANDSIYGLGGGVWSQDLDKAVDVAAKLNTGTVWVNDYHLLDAQYPFGGYKQSGIGRELGTYGLKEYTEVKHVHVSKVPHEAKGWFMLLLS